MVTALKTMRRYVLPLAVFLFGTAQAIGNALNSYEYEDLREIALTILKEYPPEHYHYVGVGGSPTPVIAFLQNLGVSAHTVPFSTVERFGERLIHENSFSSAVYRHFDHYLPSDTPLGKGLLVMDFANTGTGIQDFKNALISYMLKRERDRSIKFFAIYSGRPVASLDSSFRQIDGKRLGSGMLLTKYKSYREYPKWEVGKRSERWKSSRAYTKFKASLRDQMLADRRLKTHLQTFGLQLPQCSSALNALIKSSVLRPSQH